MNGRFSPSPEWGVGPPPQKRNSQEQAPSSQHPPKQQLSTAAVSLVHYRAKSSANLRGGATDTHILTQQSGEEPGAHEAAVDAPSPLAGPRTPTGVPSLHSPHVIGGGGGGGLHSPHVIGGGGGGGLHSPHVIGGGGGGLHPTGFAGASRGSAIGSPLSPLQQQQAYGGAAGVRQFGGGGTAMMGARLGSVSGVSSGILKQPAPHGIASAPDVPHLTNGNTVGGADGAATDPADSASRLPAIGAGRPGGPGGYGGGYGAGGAANGGLLLPFIAPPPTSTTTGTAADPTTGPILVTYAKAAPNKTSFARAASRRRAGPDADGHAAIAAAAAAPGGSGFIRGLRRFFGMGGDAAAAAAAASIAPVPDEAARQEEAAAAAAQRSDKSVAALRVQFNAEQERYKKVRSSLLAPPEAGAGAGGGAEAGVGEAAGGKARPMWEERVTRMGKSFTQQAGEDPKNPMYRSARNLAKVQEQLSYLDDPNRDKGDTEAVMHLEKPTLMPDGWKV